MSPKAPSVQLILGIDEEYRKKAAAGQLKKIAPKKLNPEGKAWLPIMSTGREGWRFTVLFSNTQRAHELGKTNDWVVVYYNDGSGERKCTVVTEFKEQLNGKRVIRGREKECGEYYEALSKRRTP
jgi:putative hydrolase